MQHGVTVRQVRQVSPGTFYRGDMSGKRRRAARKAAREAESSTALKLLARSGFVANGVVHVLIGAVMLVIAWGGDAETDQSGVFKGIAAAPFGFVLLWVIAAALWALGVWHILDGILAPRASSRAKWGRRLSEWSQAAVFLAIGTLSASVALGAKPNADQTAEDVSRGVLYIPGGVFMLAAVGLAFAITGISFVAMGVRRDFSNRVRIVAGPMGRVVTVLGIVGFVAKGLALLIVGVLLLVAAVQLDPDATGGLDAAVKALLAMPFGHAITALIGGGLIVYGAFCMLRGKYADL